MIRSSIDGALTLNELIDRLTRIRAREGNIPVCCYGGNGADYWAAGVHVVPWDNEGPRRVVFDELPSPEEIEGSVACGARAIR